MEMIPDQKPPVPRGEGPLGKVLFFGVIALVLSGTFLYVMFPPLKALGQFTLRNGDEFTVYQGISTRVDGKRVHVAISETPENASLELLAALAITHCEAALEKPFLLDTRQRLAPEGEITVRFVQGGRYLYRFYAVDDWQLAYARGTCTVAPYLSDELEGWVPNRWKFTDDSGETELEIWFRWAGRDDRPDLPMKDVCEKVLSNPLRAFRERMAEDIDTITIVAEWGYFGAFEISSWRSQKFKRVNNLCLEIGLVEEDA